MNIYYIDYENVSSQGLKGIELLTENDEVVLLYSKKADNVKIDILTTLMASRATIRFLPVHVGTPNALDFQLVTLLFLHYRPENYCYIISKDSGYDCCIKTAAENGASNVARFPNIESAVNGGPAKKTRRQKRSVSETDPVSNPAAVNKSNAGSDAGHPGSDADPAIQLQGAAGSAHQKDSAEAGAVEQESAPHAPEDTGRKKTSRRRSKKKITIPEIDTDDLSTVLPESVSGFGKKSNSDYASNGSPKAVDSERIPAGTEMNKPAGTIEDKASEKPAKQTEDNASEKPAKQAEDNASEKPAKQAEDNASEKPAQPIEDKTSEKPAGTIGDKASDKEAQTGKPRVSEHVLSQRYLSGKFDQRNAQLQAGARSDAEKPVSILSVVRRRNDVQLDMHQIDLIREALKNSGNKQQFYSYFVKKLGQKKGIELYHSIKSSYTDLVNANLL